MEGGHLSRWLALAWVAHPPTIPPPPARHHCWSPTSGFGVKCATLSMIEALPRHRVRLISAYDGPGTISARARAAKIALKPHRPKAG